MGLGILNPFSGVQSRYLKPKKAKKGTVNINTVVKMNCRTTSLFSGLLEAKQSFWKVWEVSFAVPSAFTSFFAH